ncbi:DUF6153 family protein [Streptomyces sp. NPDC059477]|uniref:DUF6153 family protein n=1 Tax=Streptomyces sp. NPDC059477 TaxID=3346847 RepID=UPI0036B00910
MTSTPQRTSRRPSGRAVLLLVFAVLAGVLAMHGLGPGGAPASHAEHGMTAAQPVQETGTATAVRPVQQAGEGDGLQAARQTGGDTVARPFEQRARAMTASHAVQQIRDTTPTQPVPEARAHGVEAGTTPDAPAPHDVHCTRATGDDGGSGHARHADVTCAASGVSTSYATPALASALEPAASPLVPPGRAAAATDSGRAPPDLAQLQLLRI